MTSVFRFFKNCSGKKEIFIKNDFGKMLENKSWKKKKKLALKKIFDKKRWKKCWKKNFRK